jgi:hypothetical protein
VEGRPVPAGWYSQPIWKPALAGAAGAIGGMLIFSALFPAGLGGGGYDQGSGDGMDHGGDAGADTAADPAAADFGGGDFGGGFDI